MFCEWSLKSDSVNLQPGINAAGVADAVQGQRLRVKRCIRTSEIFVPSAVTW